MINEIALEVIILILSPDFKNIEIMVGGVSDEQAI